jgi:hypothetical protein
MAGSAYPLILSGIFDKENRGNAYFFIGHAHIRRVRELFERIA